MAGGLRPIASAPIASLPASTSRGVPETIFGADLVHWYRDGWTGTEVVDLIDSANNMTADTGREPSAGSVNGHVTADFPGVDDLVAAGDVTTMDGATALTIFGTFNASPGQGAYATIIGKLYSGYGFHVGANSTGDRLIAAVGSDVTSGFEASSDADPFDGTWHRFIVTWTGSGGTGTCTIYLDGVAQTVVGTVTDAAVPDVSDLLSMGGATFNNTSLFDFFFAGDIANVGIAIRAATSGEVSDLDTYLSDWLSSANAYTLTAAQASYAWTRNAANLRAQRKVTAAQASFTWTRNAANLAHGYALSAAQSSFTWTRNTAGLTKTSRLVAAQGSIALTGQAASIVAQRRITADQASFALTGQAANVRAQRRLAAAQAAFSITGQASSFIRTVRMLAVQASYALSGQAANVVAQRRVTAAQSSFTWTRNAAGLAVQRKLTAAQASFAETGQAAGLTKQSRIVAAFGSYSLTGQAAGLVYGSAGSYTLGATQASFAWTRNAAALTKASRLVAAQGSLAWTGNAANLLRGVRMTAAQGSLAWTRNAAGLTAQRRIAAAQASFALTGTTTIVRPARRLTATFAAYSLTGQAANLLVPKRLTAAQAAFALSGVAASLVAGRRISAGVALFTLTGGAALFLRTIRLPAGTGLFTLTGFDAALAATNLSANWYELRPRVSRSLYPILAACPTVAVRLRASSGTLVRLLEPATSARLTPAASESARVRPRVSRSIDHVLAIRPPED